MHPFSDGDARLTFEHGLNEVLSEIRHLENEYVLSTSPTELEQYYLTKVTITPLVLDSSNYYIEDQSAAQVDVTNAPGRMPFQGRHLIVKGTRLNIAVPYTGEQILWRLSPTAFGGAYPDIRIEDDRVVFSHVFADDSPDAERMKDEIRRNVESLASGVQRLASLVADYNEQAARSVRTAIDQKMSQAAAAVGAVKSLGIPMRLRSDAATYTLPTKRRETPVSRPVAAQSPFKPEPVLEQKEFEHILSILKSMALVMERSPASFASLDEEGIRTHFLLQLNGHYEGDASGETFNAVGKTDILIRVDNRNVFIAETKFWRGPKSFSDAIDQLLGYLSWRDSKCALLVFNQTKDSTAVRQKMHEAVTNRPEYRKTVSHDSKGESQYIFVKTSDPGREVQICTLLFDVPTASP